MKGVFVLELDGGNYYVGQSEDMKGCVRGYLGESCPKWIKKYPIKDIVEVFKVDNESVVKNLHYEKVLQLMQKHGYNSVRGGCWHHGDDYKSKPKKLKELENGDKLLELYIYENHPDVERVD